MMLYIVIDTYENIALRRRCRNFLYGESHRENGYIISQKCF